MEMKSFKLAKGRYNAIRKRSFKNMLDLFLFEPIVEMQDLDKKITLDLFIEFIEPKKDPDQRQSQLEKREELIQRSRRAWELSRDSDLIWKKRTVKEVNICYNKWYDEHNDLYEEIRDAYNNRFMSVDEFVEFYGADHGPRKCYYCGITEDNIKSLFEKDRLYTKRFSTRGKTMEVDRIEPNEEYKKDNIVLCCYWCNNAKTDEFNEEEFKKIAKVIKKVWGDRLESCKLM